MTERGQGGESRPLVSVIIPVYNMAAWLEQTINSVLASTYPSVEIVLVDDQSVDDSLAICQRYAARYPNVSCFCQPNAGASSARNHAISRAKGTYILPVDADDLISPHFIALAVEAIEAAGDAVKAVCCSAEFIGERRGVWKLPPFRLGLLARKNILNITALYRKADWERVGGYNQQIKSREDWIFWIAVLKDGGDVIRLPHVGLFYRIRSGSKRIADRADKKQVVDLLNDTHPEFFQRQLNGPLHYMRSWSRAFNAVLNCLHRRTVVVAPEFRDLENFMYRIPSLFARQQGKCIHTGRNQLRLYHEKGYQLVVKAYRRPHLINRIAYGWFRQSKAERAWRYGVKLLDGGFGTPQPVGFLTRRRWFLFDDSYSVSLKSPLPYVYNHLNRSTFSRQTEILQAIARMAARLHDEGILHKDFSGGNILFDDQPEVIPLQLVDLNRIVFTKVDMDRGCRNFERLPGSDDMIRTMAVAYAQQRGFDPEVCTAHIRRYIQQEVRTRQKRRPG